MVELFSRGSAGSHLAGRKPLLPDLQWSEPSESSVGETGNEPALLLLLAACRLTRRHRREEEQQVKQQSGCNALREGVPGLTRSFCFASGSIIKK